MVRAAFRRCALQNRRFHEAPNNRNALIKSSLSQCGYSIDNCSRHNNLTIKKPAWTAFEKRWKSWRNRTASNCEGHKKDTAESARPLGRCDSCLAFDGVARACSPRPLPKRPMTGQKVGF